jgi:hypothetical protein
MGIIRGGVGDLKEHLPLVGPEESSISLQKGPKEYLSPENSSHQIDCHQEFNAKSNELGRRFVPRLVNN